MIKFFKEKIGGGTNIEKGGDIQKSDFFEKYETTVSQMQNTISILGPDWEEIRENKGFLPYSDCAIEVLEYLVFASKGPILTSFFSDALEYLDKKYNRSDVELKKEKIDEFLNFGRCIHSSQEIIYYISDNEESILKVMEKFKKNNEPADQQLEFSDIRKVELFYEKTEKLNSNLKVISAFLEKNIK